MHCFNVWLLLLVFRLIGVIVIQSWFVPDEVYQSSEVAHRAIFGTGHLSWEWKYGLRSPIHPASIAAIFRFLQMIGFDSHSFVVSAPRVFHAFLFSLGDVSFYKLTRRLVFPADASFYSFLTYLSSWFVIYCAPRTLSNSVETALTLIALLWYPFENKTINGVVWPYIFLGVITIVIRPTAALIWFVFGIYHIWRHPNPLLLLLYTVFPVAIPTLLLSAVVDSLCYARPTFALWNFLYFNVLQGGSAFFGVHPWFWFLTEGLTSVLTLQLIPIVFGLFASFRPTLLPFASSVFYIIFHSFLPHKEQRFILPVIPLLCLYAGPFFACRRTRIRRFLLVVMVVVNASIAIYCGIRHQVGPYNAANSILLMARKEGNISIIALMPCYSIPGYSYFHSGIHSIRMLDCSPNVGFEKGSNEADEFHEDPEIWLERHWNEIRSYSHILMFENMYVRLAFVVTRLHYSVCDRVFHTDFIVSDRQDHYIVILCRT